MQRTIDYAPLLEPVEAAKVRNYRDAYRRARPTMSASKVIGIVVVVVCVIFFVGVSVVMAVGAFFALLVGEPFGFIGLILPFVLFVSVGVLVVRPFLTGSTWEKRYRLHRFATANALVYEPESPNPQYPGAIFSLGSSRRARDHVRSPDGRYLDYGNYSFTTGSGKNRRAHHWGFLALHLDRSLPHMVLDAKANNSMLGTNLPMTFARDQRLSLEGDFDQHFTLYCPKQYERDALYVFTPDLMALLVDHAAPFDVEIIDRWMFVYSQRPFDMGRPELHQRLLHIVDTVGAKTLSQTDRYRDERVGQFTANVVAIPGQRLRRGVSVAGVVITMIAVAVWMLPLFLENLT
jgi:hypothetical protein